MLRLTRSFHSTGKVLQESATISQSRTQITSYLQYFQTSRELRPLVYRKKNSSELLSRDLFNDVTKTRVVPLDPVALPPKSALTHLIQEVSTVDELEAIKKEMLALSKKPQYTTAEHLLAFLEKSSSLNKLPHALTYLYSQRSLREISTADNLNLILVYLYLNPHKTLEQKLQKAQIAMEKIRDVDSISLLLKSALFKQNGDQTSIPDELLTQLQTTTTQSIIPQLDLTKGPGSLAKQFSSHRAKYLQLKPIALELANVEELANVQSLQDSLKFVKDYEELTLKLNKSDQFDELKQLARFETGKSRDSEEVAAAEEEAK
ncbi:hypothetical protein WICPIJ_009629 [Wickerhamomyces pijperi]|uniref:UvrC family homology region profile domain-containing protein n=1 Tax=Wickerhamomyces pijperi TaxID=599730 RepID=A0A9P8TCN5_WICPI|nr:hypothetical protein WICPIJ_009629 [Wickerhamomyces pijperi]